MQQLAKKGLLVAVAATGTLASAAVGVANAGSVADGAAAGSPGVASGNNVQVPVHVPVNLCGNTINVVGALNPAFGNNCSNGTQTPPPPVEPPCEEPPQPPPPPVEPPCEEPPLPPPPPVEPPTEEPPLPPPPPTEPPTEEPPLPPPPPNNPPTEEPPLPPPPPGTPPTTPPVTTPPVTTPPPSTTPGNPGQVKSVQGRVTTGAVTELPKTGSEAAMTLAPMGAAFVLGGVALYRRSKPTEG